MTWALVRERRPATICSTASPAHLHLPPLRRRDLPWLVQTMLEQQQPPAQPPAHVARCASPLRAHPAGNLRELHNAIAYARAVCEGGVIELHDLPEALLRGPGGERGGSQDATIKTIPRWPCRAPRRSCCCSTCALACWNISAVAHQMGLSRMTKCTGG